VRVLGGPIGRRVDSPETYYTLLRRLPWMEAGVGLAMLAVVLILLAGRARMGRKLVAGVLVAAGLLAAILGGFDPVGAGALVVALALTFWPRGEDEGRWGGWLGLIGLVLLAGLVAQMAAPEAAHLLIWPGLAAALAAAATALIGARLTRWAALAPAAAAGVLVGGWLLGYGHGVFLGIGMDLPGALGLIALLLAMLVRPLAPGPTGARGLAIGAAVCLVLACGLSLGGRLAEPAPPPAAVIVP